MTKKYHLMDYFTYRRSNYRKTLYSHRHTEFEIFYFHHGSGTYFVENEFIDLAPGDLIIINGVCRHGSLMKEACTRTMLRFDESHVMPLIGQMNSIDLLEPFRDKKHCYWRLSEQERLEIEEIFKKIERFNLKPGNINFHRLRIAFIELLLFICDIKERRIVDETQFSEDKFTRVQQIIDYINRNYMKELTLDQLSNDLFFSKYYLSRVFKEVSGMTIFEYVNKVRVNQAKMLFLMNRNLRITDVCFKVGFSQPTHFSRVFKQIVGVSPESYRKSIELENSI